MKDGEDPATARSASGALRTTAAIGALALVWLALALPPVFLTDPICDDVTWAKRSLYPWWFPYQRMVDPDWASEALAHQQNHQWTNERYREYHYAIDHPSVTRIVYGAVLAAMGADRDRMPDWDFSVSLDENFRKGRVLPARERTALRLVNVAFVLGMLVLAYHVFARVADDRLLALGGAALVALDPSLTVSNMGSAVYIGSDAIFLFLLVLVWFVWLGTKDRGFGGALATGALAGLATSCKLSGAFAVIAVVAYWVLYSRGMRRAHLSLSAGLASVIVFVLLNPVYLGGLEWSVQVFRDTLTRRAFVKYEHLVTANLQKLTPAEILFTMLPQAYLVVPFGLAVVFWRRAWWFRVTAFWSLSFAVCNVLFLYMFLPKYAAPVRVACSVLVVAATLETVLRVWRQRRHADAGRDFPSLAVSDVTSQGG